MHIPPHSEIRSRCLPPMFSPPRSGRMSAICAAFPPCVPDFFFREPRMGRVYTPWMGPSPATSFSADLIWLCFDIASSPRYAFCSIPDVSWTWAPCVLPPLSGIRAVSVSLFLPVSATGVIEDVVRFPVKLFTERFFPLFAPYFNFPQVAGLSFSLSARLLYSSFLCCFRYSGAGC